MRTTRFSQTSNICTFSLLNFHNHSWNSGAVFSILNVVSDFFPVKSYGIKDVAPSQKTKTVWFTSLYRTCLPTRHCRTVLGVRATHVPLKMSLSVTHPLHTACPKTAFSYIKSFCAIVQVSPTLRVCCLSSCRKSDQAHEIQGPQQEMHGDGGAWGSHWGSGCRGFGYSVSLLTLDLEGKYTADIVLWSHIYQI